MASNLKSATATGALISGDARLKSAALMGGSAAATLVLDDSTDGTGTVELRLAAGIGTTAVWTAADPEGVLFGTGIYATLTGAGAAVSIEYE